MKILTIIVITAILCQTANAKVFVQDTGVNVGWMQEISSSSKESEQYSRSFITAHHRTIADWGSVFVKGQIENFGSTSDTLDGEDGDTWFIGMATVYYNLNDSGLMAWYDIFANQNQNVAEMHNILGLAYTNKFGGLAISGGLGMDYFSGHTPLGSAEGLLTPVARLTTTYSLSKNLNAFAVVNAHLNRDTDALTNSFASWKKTGHQILAGVRYTFAPQWDLNMTYRNFNNWGGYTNNGQSIVTTVGYHF
jgi:opacity protein-like surface antigen